MECEPRIFGHCYRHSKPLCRLNLGGLFLLEAQQTIDLTELIRKCLVVVLLNTRNVKRETELGEFKLVCVFVLVFAASRCDYLFTCYFTKSKCNFLTFFSH